MESACLNPVILNDRTVCALHNVAPTVIPGHSPQSNTHHSETVFLKFKLIGRSHLDFTSLLDHLRIALNADHQYFTDICRNGE